jgi:hypothetical protein
MPLPSVLGTGSIKIAGETIEYHALSRASVFAFQKITDSDEAEIFALVHGTAYSEQEITEWRENAGLEIVGPLVDAIVVLSGIVTQAQVDAVNKRRLGKFPETQTDPS